ncbi:MAG: pilin [Patescibacteria group bacterium]
MKNPLKFLVVIILFVLIFSAQEALALRTCTSAADCRAGENCTELYSTGQCIDGAGDRIYYITGRCSGIGAVACPSGFTCQDIPSRGMYCITNEAGMASTRCPEGQEFKDGACRTPSTATTGPVEFTSPIGAVSPTQLIGKAIKTVLGILGAVALLIFVYGGFVWMTSGGSPEKIKTARTTLVWAVLGMAVIFLSYAAVDFVLKAFGV